MSTRCQIEFSESNGQARADQRDRRTIYQHCDGYPDGECGVIEQLRRFFAWDRPHRGFDLEYTPANYIFWCKRRDIEHLRTIDPERSAQEADDLIAHLGYGLCNNNEFHPDIEFFYEVLLEQRTQSHPLSETLWVKPYRVEAGRAHTVRRAHFKPLAEVVLWKQP